MNLLCKFFDHKITERKNINIFSNGINFEGKCNRCKKEFYVVEIDKIKVYTKL